MNFYLIRGSTLSSSCRYEPEPDLKSLCFSEVFRYRKTEILYFTSKFLNYELKPLIP
jgi:hypothetical protein